MRVEEPANLPERELLESWLAFHRDALAAKCEGLSDAELVSRPALPSDLSLLGLVRHLTEMERVYLVHAIGGGGQLELVCCTDDEPDADIIGLTVQMAAESVDRWHREREVADSLLAQQQSLDEVVSGNSFSLRWNLLKLIQEYARHNGHADLIRERIDGATGE